MSLAEALGLPHEDELPDDEEVRNKWHDLFEDRIIEMIVAEVAISLADWRTFSILERGLYQALKEQHDSFDVDGFIESLDLGSLGNFETLFEDIKEAVA